MTRSASLLQFQRFRCRSGSTVAVGAIALTAVVTVGCSRPQPEPPLAESSNVTVEPQPEIPAPPETVLVSSDGISQVTLPMGWEAENDLHDSAELQAANYDRQLYVIVLSESKDVLQEEEPNTDWTMETHSETTRQLLEARLKTTGEIEVSEPTDLTVGEYPAIQSEMRGKLGDLNVVYLHTTVETPTYFHQILAWTVPDALEENREELEGVIQSFEEIPESERSPAASTESETTESETSEAQPSDAEPSPEN